MRPGRIYNALASLGFTLILFVFNSSLAQENNDLDDVEYSLFLIGDAGEFNEAAKNNLNSLKKEMDISGKASSTIFLGDNIYPKGMPEIGHKNREMAEQILKQQLDVFQNYKGRAIVVHGNHDWERGRKDGFNSIQRIEEFGENYLNGRQVFFPGNGCVGPYSFEAGEDILVIIYDSQWILQPGEKSAENESCPTKTGLDLFAQLQELIRVNEDKKIVLIAHHPVISYGEHGGRFSFRQHLFPLTDAQKSLYLPLPIVGSIYPLYRKFIGGIQDNVHPMNKMMRSSVQQLAEMHPNIIYVSGHEHSLQYISRNNAHYVISGSGSKTSHTGDGKYSEFTGEETGYARLDFYNSGSVKLVFKTGESINGIYSKELYKKEKVEKTDLSMVSTLNFNGQVMKAHVSDQYIAGKGKQRWFGSNYRELWVQDVEMPVFDIGTEHGGLEIVQRGGGFQTKSLRLEAKDGKQYVLRSIEKYTEKAIPKVLRGSFAADVVQDQISAAHPYGAFIIPYLADSAGIYHTNPKVVYIPDDERFEKHQSEFANSVALYEERPSRNWEDAAHFGNAKKIVNTDKVIKSLKKDNDNYVDQKFVLRNRLFDLFIGDWDRHEDQWRWAAFKEKKGTKYRPIPRDRDQAFFLNQGIIPKLASRKWAMPKFQGFDYELKNVPGFMFNARYFDRSFLNELEKEDWIKQAKKLQKNMSDAVIDDAVAQWPDSIYEKSGREVSSKLKSRRGHLEDYALSHYYFLSKKVDVVGSDKNELFEIERLDNGDSKVQVFKLNKKGEKKDKLYSRTFGKEETKEIRLYGLSGNDQFKLFGNSKSAIKTRVIGGEGEDYFNDDSAIKGWSRNSLFYDTRSGNNINKGQEGRNLTSKRPEINEYNRKSFKYNLTIPLVIGAYNPDDGVFLGAGFLRTTHGFRKDPYKSQHLFLGKVALGTGAFDFKYTGTFNHVIGSLDVRADVDIEGPNFVMNYFGFGNESVYDQENDIEYYRVRFDNIFAKIQLRKRISEQFKLAIGPSFENVNIHENDGRFLENEIVGGDTTFPEQHFGGGIFDLEFDNRDNRLMPKKGIYTTLSAKSMAGLNEYSNDYGSISAFFAFYLSFREPSTITISNRVGGGHSLGDFAFYQANTLGGIGKNTNLRGYRRTRFYGNTSFYNNTELRLTLFGFRTYLFPSHVGLLFFHDIGRVWAEGEESDNWHRGVGTGLWLTPFESMVLSLSLAWGEESIVNFRFGFLF